MNNNTTFTISKDKTNKAWELAGKEFAHWQEIRSRRGNRRGKQCTNTMTACNKGTLGEMIAAEYLQDQNENNIVLKMVCAGLMERASNMFLQNHADIEIETVENGSEKIEVKTISKGQPMGQITEYHADNYGHKRVNRVLFVELTFNDDDTVSGEVYIDATIQEIKSWPKFDNRYGKPCYTHPDYIDTLK